MPKGVYKIYFDNNGDMLDRLHSYYNPPGSYKEEDNHVFSDKIEYAGYCGSHIIFKSVNTKRKYYMFISDFDKMMKRKLMIDNAIEGEFTFCKKGVVQGLKMILPPEP